MRAWSGQADAIVQRKQTARVKGEQPLHVTYATNNNRIFCNLILNRRLCKKGTAFAEKYVFQKSSCPDCVFSLHICARNPSAKLLALLFGVVLTPV